MLFVFFNRNSLTEDFSEEELDVELSKAEGTSSSEEKQCGMHCGPSNKDAFPVLFQFAFFYLFTFIDVMKCLLLTLPC